MNYPHVTTYMMCMSLINSFSSLLKPVSEILTILPLSILHLAMGKYLMNQREKNTLKTKSLKSILLLRFDNVLYVPESLDEININQNKPKPTPLKYL